MHTMPSSPQTPAGTSDPSDFRGHPDFGKKDKSGDDRPKDADLAS